MAHSSWPNKWSHSFWCILPCPIFWWFYLFYFLCYKKAAQKHSNIKLNTCGRLCDGFVSYKKDSCLQCHSAFTVIISWQTMMNIKLPHTLQLSFIKIFRLIVNSCIYIPTFRICQCICPDFIFRLNVEQSKGLAYSLVGR